MQHRIVFVIIIFIFIFSISCKKDLLYFQNVLQLNSHTNADRLDRILFVNDTLGFVAGGQRFYNSVILTTRDGGYNWTKDTFPQAGKEIFGIVQSPSGGIYACGFDGKLLYSNDMGDTWNFSQMQYLAEQDLAFTDSTHAIVVGGQSFYSGYMSYVHNNGGFIKWDSLGYQINRIKMLNNGTGYLCGYGVISKTTNNAQTWNILNVQGDDFTGMDIHNNGQELWVCGYQGRVFHSADGGNSWQRLRNGNDITIAHYQLLDIFFKDSENGWAVGENGLVLYSNDGGNNWMQYNHFTDNGLRSLSLQPNGDLIVCGDNGALYRITPQL
jgi:photosystem II stability/assembly factor-like uncharacterized protein